MSKIERAWIALRVAWALLANSETEVARRRFDEAYLTWIRERWDAGEGWVRGTWEVRP